MSPLRSPRECKPCDFGVLQSVPICAICGPISPSVEPFQSGECVHRLRRFSQIEEAGLRLSRLGMRGRCVAGPARGGVGLVKYGAGARTIHESGSAANAVSSGQGEGATSPALAPSSRPSPHNGVLLESHAECGGEGAERAECRPLANTPVSGGSDVSSASMQTPRHTNGVRRGVWWRQLDCSITRAWSRRS